MRNNSIPFMLLLAAPWCVLGWSSFHGTTLKTESLPKWRLAPGKRASIEMRKQKASDRRTRRLQRGDIVFAEDVTGVTHSPMQGRNWNLKKRTHSMQSERNTGGRGRSRKRSALYNSLSFYHNKYLNLLTKEYRQEEEEVLRRIKASLDDPLSYEMSGFALFDMYAERRGNLYSDEVYRLTKAYDFTTIVSQSPSRSQDSNQGEVPSKRQKTNCMERFLPPNHKFSSNDVIMLTLQPQGSGDFFGATSLPTNGLSMEARVLSVGPTYIDVAAPVGNFAATFGPAPNDSSGKGDRRMRLRVDRFFSSIPYHRMVSALTQLSCVPDKQSQQSATNEEDSKEPPGHERICMDELFREVILTTHAYSDPFSSYHQDNEFCDLQYLASCLAKPPMGSSQQLAKKASSYIRSNEAKIFENFNEPQLAAITAALTRRLTLIQGPPGTGKTSVASAIAFGFALQCRALSQNGNAKVLACACSNVGADNLANRMLKQGLKVVRVGRPSAVSEALWNHTLDAFINNDEDAQAAMKQAAQATSALATVRKKPNSKQVNGDISRDLATAAVKASIQACNVAATKALRTADVIVSTSTGASDPRLLAACGIRIDADGVFDASGRLKKANGKRATSDIDRDSVAPDGLPPLSCPFVIIDESCQSVEPETLIPITATNSCRGLVLLGDPCQLPPTVRSGDTASPLTESLMARLATVLPHPLNNMPRSRSKDVSDRYLESLPIKQARSRFQNMRRGEQQESYRRRYSGCILLSLQYRMHPSISALPSAIFYDGLLATPAFLSNARQFPRFLGDAFPCVDNQLCVRMIDVGGRNNERRGAFKVASQFTFAGQEGQTSYWNEAEAEQVVSLVKAAVAAAVGDPSDPKDIGIVTPYRSQVDLIKKKLSEEKDLVTDMDFLSIEVEVKTIDGYQGRERDLIIFSAVRSNRKGDIGFLGDWRRLNVALTRARSGCVVVGDSETLSEQDEHWATFVQWCTEVQCIFPSTQSRVRYRQSKVE